MQFNYMTQLPYELQSEIYSEYNNNLIQSQSVNKLSRNITKQAFLQQICTKPITRREINEYLRNLPDHLYFFYQEIEENRTIHMGVMKYNVIEIITLDEYQYNLSFEMVITDYDTHTVTYNVIQRNVITKDQFDHHDREPDLLTQYFIYRNRHCDNIKQEFSKHKILTILQNKYNQLYKNDYVSLLSFYLYIRVNLLRFPVQLPKNIFINYIVTDTIVIDVSGLSVSYEQVMIDLYDQVNILYDELVKQINKLE